MRYAMLGSSVLLGFVYGAPPMHPDVDDFKKRTGLGALAGGDSPCGVAFDWSAVPAAIANQTGGVPVYSSSAAVLEPGLAESDWFWKDERLRLSVKAYVSGRGPRGAREQLLSTASATMMRTIPFEAGPAGLGELAVHNIGQSLRVIIWVFENVCVEVASGDGSVAVEPVARAIQHLIASHVVPRLADLLPKVEGVEVAPRQIHVGESVRIHVRMGKGVTRESLLADSREVGGPHLEPGDDDGLSATYRGVTPGQAHIEVRIADRKSLLSPSLQSAVVDVLHERP